MLKSERFKDNIWIYCKNYPDIFIVWLSWREEREKFRVVAENSVLFWLL